MISFINSPRGVKKAPSPPSNEYDSLPNLMQKLMPELMNNAKTPVKLLFENINIPLVISFENETKNESSIFFKKTLDKLAWENVFIGKDVKWEGVSTKIYNYYEYLKNLPEDKVVVLSDARDVFCVRNPISFLDCIKNIISDNKIIISAEMFLQGHMDWSEEETEKALKKDPNTFWQGMPLAKYWEYHKISPLPLRKYLNSGLIVGKTKDLKSAFEWVIKNNFKDDQLGLSCYAYGFPDKVYLDYEAKILHTSGFGVNGALYDTKQNQDSPTMAEFIGMGSYFLHLPGLNTCKGQKYIYNISKKIIELNILENDSMYKLYNVKETDKYEYSYYEYVKKNR